LKYFDRLLRVWRFKKADKHVPYQSTILDIGAFDGYFFRKIEYKLKYGIGIEPLLNTDVVRSNNYVIYKDTFPDTEVDLTSYHFNVITMLAVLEHILPEKQKILSKKCHDLLTNDGIIIITVPSKIVDRIIDVLKFFKVIHGMSDEQHYGFNPNEVFKIFCEPNFTLIHTIKFQLGLNNLFIFKRNNSTTL
jgi:SAM-dependent methyltransferase